MEGSNARVRVIVRVRPLRDKEKRDRSVKEIVKPPLNNSNDQTLSIYDPASPLAGVRSELIDSWAREFTFDKCLWRQLLRQWNTKKDPHRWYPFGVTLL